MCRRERVAAVLRGGQTTVDRDGQTPVKTAHRLLTQRIDGSTLPSEVAVHPDLLADLHEPGLIITPDYVGRDRRLAGLRPDRNGGRRRSSGPSVRFVHLVLAVVATTIAVIPLTLLASDALGAAPSAGQASAHPAAFSSAIRTATQRRRAETRSRAAKRATEARLQRASGAASRPAAACATSAVAPSTRLCTRLEAGAGRRAQRLMRQAVRAERRQAAKPARPSRPQNPRRPSSH